MDAALEIKRAYKVRKYLDVDHRDPEPCSLSCARSPFASFPPAFSPLSDSLETIVELVTARSGAFAAFVALVEGDSQHLLAICEPENEMRELLCDRTRWMGDTDDDKQAWLWLARQVLSVHTSSAHERRTYINDRLGETEQTLAMSCVIGEPHARYFVAVPITTSRGYDIGYLAVVGQATFGGLTPAQLGLLERLAQRSISLLEAAREKHIQGRWSKMNTNLERFLYNPDVHTELLEDPPSFLEKTDQTGKGVEVHPYSEQDQSGMHGHLSLELGAAESAKEVQRETNMAEETDRSTPAPKEDTSTGSEGEDKKSSSRTKKRETTYRMTFQRAARCLREALHVLTTHEQATLPIFTPVLTFPDESSDGTLFVDGVIGFHGPYMPTAELEPELEVEIGEKPPNRAIGDEGTSGSSKRSPQDGHADKEQPEDHVSERVFTSAAFRKNVLTSHPGEILGVSYRSEMKPHLVEVSSTTKAIPELDEGYLQYFLQRYSQGRVWFFDKSGKSFYLEQDQLIQESDFEEMRRLNSAFPGAIQLIFCPLVNPVSLKSLAGFFAWTGSESPVLTDTVDLAAIKNFCYMVEAEISRNDNAAAMKQQESFVASVSHELRTPLHGILGAAQFLSDTKMDSFQASLLETIELSGSTLHDTLTSVLSYAKINQFERRQDKPRQDGPQDSPWHLAESRDQSEEKYEFHGYHEEANIVSLCEDVLSVVEAGRSYKSIASRDVTVTMRAEYRENWNFITEPGAFRRVALNIVGNALKYTTSGTVEVSLRTTDLKDDRPRIARTGPKEPRRLVIFMCKDTGKGMTKTFIDRQLFLPFSQEDPVSSSGVGLGMSIVKSLVSVLGGEIYVSSAVNQGTEIQVRLPMTIVGAENASPSSSNSKFHDNVQSLRKRNLGVLVHGFPSEERSCMDAYLVDWFKCRILSADDESVEPDVVIVDEGGQDITESFFKTTPRWGHRGALLSITPARLTRPIIITERDGVWERKPRPIGPKRFASAIAACIEKLDELRAKGMPPSEREIEEIDENGEIQSIGSGQLHAESELPNDHNEEIPPTSLEPLSEAMRNEIDQPDTTAATSPRSLAIRVNADRTDPRIMIVEDNAVNLRLLKIFIEKCGYRDVATAINGAIAVDAAQTSDKNFDIIFMDLSMPVMDGFDATRKIREIEAERQASTNETKPAHIVALTGLASKQDEELAFSAGVDLFFTKPVQFKRLEVLFKEWETAQLEPSSSVPPLDLAEAEPSSPQTNDVMCLQ